MYSPIPRIAHLAVLTTSVGILFGLMVLPLAEISPRCHWIREYGVACPTCGLTRSILALRSGDLAQSVHYHPAGWLLVAALVFEILLRVAAIRGRALSGIADLSVHTPLLAALFCALNFLPK